MPKGVYERKKRLPEERFWEKVHKIEDVICSPFVDDPCWVWTGARNTKGYGRIKANGKEPKATHVVLGFDGIDVPSGMIVSHKCDNPSCVRPSHLRVETIQDGVNDRVAKGRSAHGDRHGLRLHPEKLARGDKHGMAKLTSRKVEVIRAIYTTGRISQREIARKFNVSNVTIYLIVHNHTWFCADYQLHLDTRKGTTQ